MNGEKYAFFLDIDGTLWYKGVVPDVNKEMIKNVRALGHKVLINTGRSYAYIPKSLYEQVELDGVVAGIGNSFRMGEESIFSYTMTSEDIEYVFGFFEKYDPWIIFEGEEKVVFYKKQNKTDCNFSQKDVDGARNISSKEEWDRYYSAEPISKVTVQGFDFDPDQLAALRARFEVIVHDGEDYTEIGRFGCDKGTGMLRAIEYLGIDRAHCVAMGDSANDLAMLRDAGISVAMGDSQSGIAEIADIVSTECSKGGVAEAMKRILEI